MTNKEAIEELRELIEIDLHPCPPIYEEALNLAIKALNSIEQIKFNVYALNGLIKRLEEAENE